MKTPEEIKKGLECCAAGGKKCKGCPYMDDKCMNGLTEDALSLIRQYETAHLAGGDCMALERAEKRVEQLTTELQHAEWALDAALIGLTYVRSKIIVAYAEHDMVVTDTAKALWMDHSNVSYHLNRIHRITGKNPRNGDGLAELLPLARAVVEREERAK